MRWIKYKCQLCKTIFVATDTRHLMYYCPGCNETFVDIEEHYSRFTIGVTLVEEFEPPWFDNEDDYHSAFMGWLNNSDEEYYMYKEDGILWVVKR